MTNSTSCKTEKPKKRRTLVGCLVWIYDSPSCWLLLLAALGLAAAVVWMPEAEESEMSMAGAIVVPATPEGWNAIGLQVDGSMRVGCNAGDVTRVRCLRDGASIRCAAPLVNPDNPNPVRVPCR